MLNSGVLFVSESPYWRDEWQYRGLVDFFANTDELSAIYKRLAQQMTPKEREQLSRKRYRDFSRRFDLGKVVKEAAFI